MVNASTSISSSQSTRYNLSYIDTLVSSSTAQGRTFTSVDAKYMNDSMKWKLTVEYGYKVTEIKDFQGTVATYLIDWGKANISYNYGTYTYPYRGHLQYYIVPVGINTITAQLIAATGGSGNGSTGGAGANITTSLSVTPGQILFFVVGGTSNSTVPAYGGGGYGGSTGSGNIGYAGGGLSGIFTGVTISQGNALAIAAGGGGAGGRSSVNGGAGGQPNGGVGGHYSSYTGVPGGASSLSGGGTAGTPVDSNSVNPTAGSALMGGNGGSVTNGYNGGGGAGAGYFGGGGGAAGGDATGGGSGGSSFSLSSITYNTANTSGNGSIIITATL